MGLAGGLIEVVKHLTDIFFRTRRPTVRRQEGIDGWERSEHSLYHTSVPNTDERSGPKVRTGGERFLEPRNFGNGRAREHTHADTHTSSGALKPKPGGGTSSRSPFSTALARCGRPTALHSCVSGTGSSRRTNACTLSLLSTSTGSTQHREFAERHHVTNCQNSTSHKPFVLRQSWRKKPNTRMSHTARAIRNTKRSGDPRPACSHLSHKKYKKELSAFANAKGCEDAPVHISFQRARRTSSGKKAIAMHYSVQILQFSQNF